jgi:hypothetical protein
MLVGLNKTAVLRSVEMVEDFLAPHTKGGRYFSCGKLPTGHRGRRENSSDCIWQFVDLTENRIAETARQRDRLKNVRAVPCTLQVLFHKVNKLGKEEGISSGSLMEG